MLYSVVFLVNLESLCRRPIRWYQPVVILETLQDILRILSIYTFLHLFATRRLSKLEMMPPLSHLCHEIFGQIRANLNVYPTLKCGYKRPNCEQYFKEAARFYDLDYCLVLRVTVTEQIRCLPLNPGLTCSSPTLGHNHDSSHVTSTSCPNCENLFHKQATPPNWNS